MKTNKQIVSSLSNSQLKELLVGSNLKDALLEDLFGMDSDELRYNGVAEEAIANIELMRVIFERLSRVNCIKEESLNNPSKIIEWIKFNIGFKNREEMFVIFLKADGSVIKHETLFTGTKNSCSVGVDEILRKAILSKANALIISHVHPSGNITPSYADKRITAQIKEAGNLLDIPLLDHIIVSKDNYFSFKKEGMI